MKKVAHFKMPQSSFKGQVIAPLGGVIRCPCRQSFTYVSDRDLSNKKRFCSRLSGVPTVNLNPSKKRMMIRELQLSLGEMDRKISSN